MSDRLPRSLILPEDPRRRRAQVGGDEPPISIQYFQQFTSALSSNHTQVADRIEELIMVGEAADIPAATGGGRFFYATDTSILKLDDGAWDNIGGQGLLDLYLPLTAGSGEPLTGNLFIDTAVAPALQLRPAGVAADRTVLSKDASGTLSLLNYAETGQALTRIDPIPSDNTSNALMQFFRTTNTSGNVYLDIHKGDGTATSQHRFFGDGDAELCKDNGQVSVFGDGIVDIQAASGASYLKLQAEGTAAYYADIYQYSNKLSIKNYNTGGAAYMDIDPMPASTSEAWIKLFSDTNTTGDVLFRMYIGDGTATLQHEFNCDSGNVSLCQQGGKLDVFQDLIRLRTSKTPASAGATGNQGDICWDANYIYVCVAANTWKRTAISTW